MIQPGSDKTFDIRDYLRSGSDTTTTEPSKDTPDKGKAPVIEKSQMVVNPISVTVIDSDDTDRDEEFRRASLISHAEQEERHNKIEEARLGLGGSRAVSEDPDFVPETDDTPSPINKRKRKENVVSDST